MDLSNILSNLFLKKRNFEKRPCISQKKYYLCRMFCDRKISGFANVNRVIARVCGGGTLVKMPRLREALLLPKRNGDRLIGSVVASRKGVSKVFFLKSKNIVVRWNEN